MYLGHVKILRENVEDAGFLCKIVLNPECQSNAWELCF